VRSGYVAASRPQRGQARATIAVALSACSSTRTAVDTQRAAARHAILKSGPPWGKSRSTTRPPVILSRTLPARHPRVRVSVHRAPEAECARLRVSVGTSGSPWRYAARRDASRTAPCCRRLSHRHRPRRRRDGPGHLKCPSRSMIVITASWPQHPFPLAGTVTRFVTRTLFM